MNGNKVTYFSFPPLSPLSIEWKFDNTNLRNLISFKFEIKVTLLGCTPSFFFAKHLKQVFLKFEPRIDWSVKLDPKKFSKYWRKTALYFSLHYEVDNIILDPEM